MTNLAPCPTEDSIECFWDATLTGNGQGQSFFEHGGQITPIHVPLGSHIEAVTVTTQNGTYADGPGYGVTFTESAQAAADTLAQTGGDLFTVGVLASYGLVLTLIALALILTARKGRRP